MAIQNSNLVLKNLCMVNLTEQGRDAVAGVLGHQMPPTLSQHGRPMSPGFARFEPYPMAKAKRIGRSAASLPGNSLCTRGWRKSIAWVTPTRLGITASLRSAAGQGLSTWGERHHTTSGHDYPSHDRRDDRQRNRPGFARTTNCGK
jgi:hypothetical protein